MFISTRRFLFLTRRLLNKRRLLLITISKIWVKYLRFSPFIQLLILKMCLHARVILIRNLIKCLIWKYLLSGGFIDWLWVYCTLLVVVLRGEEFWFWYFFLFYCIFTFAFVFLENFYWVQVSLNFEKVWFYFLLEIVFVETAFFNIW